MVITNSLCKLLDIRYPIVQAGMAGQTTAELVASVSNAGGLGILGATRMNSNQLSTTIKKIKKLLKNHLVSIYGLVLQLAIIKTKMKDLFSNF